MSSLNAHIVFFLPKDNNRLFKMKVPSLAEEKRERVNATVVQRRMMFWTGFLNKDFLELMNFELKNLGVSVGRECGEGQNQTKNKSKAGR